MRKFLLLFFLPFLLFAQESPEQIEAELQTAENEYNRALKMFNPWYTGPLITPSSSMMPPANGNLQPYLFIADNYATYNEDRKSISLPNSLIQLKANAILQTGVTNNMDILLNLAGQGNWRDGQSGGGFGDLGVTAGFLIFKQTPYIPGFKFTVGQTFPTGNYKNLNSNGLNASGAGAYSTQFGLATSKVILWSTKHPMGLRGFVGYQLSAPVNVSGFNAYGGGFGCNGKVKPGNTLSADLGIEFSITQRWVAALDIVYSATNRTKFHGNPGTLASGAASAVGSGYSDNLSLAPAIEYNWSPTLGIIAGGWFSVYGRNSSNFGTAVISVTWSFP